MIQGNSFSGIFASMNSIITISDIFIVPFLLLVTWLVAYSIQRRNIDEYPYFKYFQWGLFAKIFSGIAFALIYTYYYGESDTHYYYWGSQSLYNLLFKDFNSFFAIIIGGHTPELLSKFNASTGWPTYWNDLNSFAICRFNVPFYFLGLKSFLGNTIIMNVFLFSGVWRFYKLMIKIFQVDYNNLAIALLFVPSVLFWGSGILKDGWCLVAAFIFL
jgi:hypothetical protein